MLVVPRMLSVLLLLLLLVVVVVLPRLFWRLLLAVPLGFDSLFSHVSPPPACIGCFCLFPLLLRPTFCLAQLGDLW